MARRVKEMEYPVSPLTRFQSFNRTQSIKKNTEKGAREIEPTARSINLLNKTHAKYRKSRTFLKKKCPTFSFFLLLFRFFPLCLPVVGVVVVVVCFRCRCCVEWLVWCYCWCWFLPMGNGSSVWTCRGIRNRASSVFSWQSKKFHFNQDVSATNREEFRFFDILEYIFNR